MLCLASLASGVLQAEALAGVHSACSKSCAAGRKDAGHVMLRPSQDLPCKFSSKCMNVCFVGSGSSHSGAEGRSTMEMNEMLNVEVWQQPQEGN